MATDINKRVRKVLINSTLIVSISIITYLLYSTIDKNRIIAEKDKKMLVDSLTLIAKVKELKILKASYEKLEEERNSIGLANDSLVTIVTTLNQYIQEVEKKDSVNITRFKQLNLAIGIVKQKLIEEKKAFSQIEKNVKSNLAESITHHEYLDDYKDNFIIKIGNMDIEPINKQGKALPKENLKYEQIKFIRIKFTIMKNSLTTKVQKIFSVILIEPDGKPYKFNHEFDFIIIDRNKVHLTNRKRIEFGGNETPVAFLYPKSTPFKSGANTVKLFCEDVFVAEKTLEIK